MAFNSALDLEVATIVQNGSIYLWDIDHGYPLHCVVVNVKEFKQQE